MYVQAITPHIREGKILLTLMVKNLQFDIIFDILIINIPTFFDNFIFSNLSGAFNEL